MIHRALPFRVSRPAIITAVAVQIDGRLWVAPARNRLKTMDPPKAAKRPAIRTVWSSRHGIRIAAIKISSPTPSGYRRLSLRSGLRSRRVPSDALQYPEHERVVVAVAGGVRLTADLGPGVFVKDGEMDIAVDLGVDLGQVKTLGLDRKSTRLNSSHSSNSHGGFCLTNEPA